MTGDILNSSMLIFKKDLKSELRTRYVINSLLMFVLVTISVIRFALGDEKTENDKKGMVKRQKDQSEKNR